MRSNPKTAVLLVLILLTATGRADAQGTGRVMDIDPSTRSTGMGGASNALFWGDGVNHWANPSLLGYARGVGFEWDRTRLLPKLADEVVLQSTVLKIGGGGVGVVLSGQPWGLGRVKLSYGTSTVTDASGNVTGRFQAFEKVESWGVGVNAVELVENALRLGGLDVPNVSRFADVSLGMNFKTLDMSLAPGPSFSGSTDARDRGVLFRATPLHFKESDGGLPVQLDVAYGWSEINSNDDAIVFFPVESQGSPVSRQKRQGFAVHVAMSPIHWPPADSNEGPWRRWIEPSSPLFSIGLTFDHADVGTVLQESTHETSGQGLEVEVARLITLRAGHYEDKLNGIDGASWGWGLSLPLGSVARVRYDESRFPQSRDSQLSDQARRAASVWIRSVELWSLLQRDERETH